ncbi:hypothetical protein P691DRAFT_759410 [Macrolepiota fuliginosa MF-IS2]|uniref:Uncharacterized protein n=1 Tax=Macrolepiota fuliginosa MF-IS2 TaxID=1400762 RepID=A0A9P5XE33_9AGAR|nr:hypothetical protein P691DRAFT_759410 [Macrolepiota fuliginosa MF-IS2]
MTSTSRSIHTLYGTKVIDSSEPHPYGPPLPGAPILRAVHTSTPPLPRAPIPHTVRSSTPPELPESPHVATVKRSESARSRRSTHAGSSSSSRPSHPRSRHPYIPPCSAPPNLESAFHETISRYEEQIQVLQSSYRTCTRSAFSCIQREADRQRLRAETAEKELHFVKTELKSVQEERESLREKLAALSLGKAENASEEGLVQRFSSAGPLRRKPIPSRSARFSWATSLFHGGPRCKSAEPSVPARGFDDFFDVTVVDYPVHSRLAPARKNSAPELIRDASRPHDAPRPARLPYGPDEINFHHLDILYIPMNGRLFCRACHVNKEMSEDSHNVEVTEFPNNASWDDLRNHCTTEHPDECQQIAQLKAAEVHELRRRLQEKQSTV